MAKSWNRNHKTPNFLKFIKKNIIEQSLFCVRRWFVHESKGQFKYFSFTWMNDVTWMNVIYNNELLIFFFVLRMFKLFSKFTRFIYLQNIKFVDELHDM